MDSYEEALLNLVMSEAEGTGIPESWQQSNELSPYLQHLASCGVNKLSSECAQLQDEEAAVLEQTKELAYKEYLTFIHAADCSKDMLTQLSGVEDRLSASCSGIESLQETLSGFIDTSRNLLQARQLNTTTLAKHTQLLEILELSQLLDTCVRNNYHDEALEIIAYVRRLEKRHGNIPIIKSIVSEVQVSSQQMLSQLLAQLRTDTSLPQCLKVVGLIRTLDVFTECQLRIKFLHARDAWLTTALRAIPHQDPYQHLSKSMECSRVHLFDIVTQYRAIFSDEHAHLDHHQLHHAEKVDLQAILQSWLLHKVTGILSMLRRELAKGGVSGGNLESLLAQCMFFGQSLSRIGADFRALLPEIFEEAASLLLERDIRAANHKFDEALSAFSLMDVSSSAGAPSFALHPQHHAAGGAGRPPLSLLEFPPLGHYLNALVAAFNTLRLCCFTALMPLLIQLLRESLTKVVRSLLELHQLECSGFTAAETASFARLCAVLRGSLVPHVNACILALYPRTNLATRVGISAHQLAKMNFGELDVDAICEPLQPFLPAAAPTSSPDDVQDGTDREGNLDSRDRRESSDLEAGGATSLEKKISSDVTPETSKPSESGDAKVVVPSKDAVELAPIPSDNHESDENMATPVLIDSHVNSVNVQLPTESNLGNNDDKNAAGTAEETPLQYLENFAKDFEASGKSAEDISHPAREEFVSSPVAIAESTGNVESGAAEATSTADVTTESLVGQLTEVDLNK